MNASARVKELEAVRHDPSLVFHEGADAEHMLLDAMPEFIAVVEAVEQAADGPCSIYPYPPPTRDENNELVWPMNCLDDLDRGTRRGPCDRCRSKAALAALRERL